MSNAGKWLVQAFHGLMSTFDSNFNQGFALGGRKLLKRGHFLNQSSVFDGTMSGVDLLYFLDYLVFIDSGRFA